MPPASRGSLDRHNKPVVIDLNAAIVRVAEGSPEILAVRPAGVTDDDPSAWDALPFGPFDPLKHRTMEIGLRSWVQEQTQLDLGYVEQLYTFGDRGRHALEVLDEGLLAVAHLGVVLDVDVADEGLHGLAGAAVVEHHPVERRGVLLHLLEPVGHRADPLLRG